MALKKVLLLEYASSSTYLTLVVYPLESLWIRWVFKEVYTYTTTSSCFNMLWYNSIKCTLPVSLYQRKKKRIDFFFFSSIYSDPAVHALQFLDVINMKDPTQKAHFYRNTLREVLPFIPRVSGLFFICCKTLCDTNHYHKKFFFFFAIYPIAYIFII